MSKKASPKNEIKPEKQARVSQTEIPSRSLREALTIAQKITDEFGGKEAAPHQIAMALDISPTSSSWRYFCGSAIAYGLTNGSYNAAKISLTELGRRATAPTEEGDDLKAKAEAALKPTILLKFFEKYNKSKFPQDKIAKNVLAHDFQVPQERVEQILNIIKDNGQYVGFIHDTKTGQFVATDSLSPSPVKISEPDDNHNGVDSEITESIPEETPLNSKNKIENEQNRTPASQAESFKVFVTHSKNMEIVEQVKSILDLYDIDYEIAVEEETTAIPVPQKVLAGMRRCQAGLMVVTADEGNKLADSYAINNNVLIEIGAAFVLYDQQVILLWDNKLKVPSNLQGLYRCEFEGKELSFATGTKLAKAIKGFKKK
ncbi:TIR domain-containing protein [Pseudobdellovibrio sp. HCB154]|uniref:TIR domain-containing protein n=1 Tax=Pseudobdellovibrio sp. HCB154 TaxID=3386277 RepID=UPI0039170555